MRSAVIVVAAVVVATSACGGSDGGGSTSAALESAFADFDAAKREFDNSSTVCRDTPATSASASTCVDTAVIPYEKAVEGLARSVDDAAADADGACAAALQELDARVAAFQRKMGELGDATAARDFDDVRLREIELITPWGDIIVARAVVARDCGIEFS